MKLYDGGGNWKGSCKHCNRGVSVAGKLDKNGFCKDCVLAGHPALYYNLPFPEKTWEIEKFYRHRNGDCDDTCPYCEQEYEQ